MNKLTPLLLLLASCTSYHDLTGAWSGKVGPFKSTFIFYANQHGKFCYSGRGKNIVERANYEDGIIFMESGKEALIIDDDPLVIEIDVQGVEEYRFKRDDKLLKASWYCWKKLKD